MKIKENEENKNKNQNKIIWNLYQKIIVSELALRNSSKSSAKKKSENQNKAIIQEILFFLQKNATNHKINKTETAS